MEQTSDNRYLVAGSVNLKNVTIISANGACIDVLPQTVIIDLYESMFSNFLTGQIAIDDGVMLTERIKFIGHELVIIRYNTPTYDDAHEIQLEFVVSKVSRRAKEMNKSDYILDLISIEAKQDIVTRISRKYSGNPSDLVNNILVNELKTTKTCGIFSTYNNITFIANYWKPSTCLDFIANHSLGKDEEGNNDPTFLFFETFQGFVFANLRSIIARQAKTKKFNNFIFSRYNTIATTATNNQSLNTTIKNTAMDYAAIQHLQVESSFDLARRVKNGFYGTKLIGVDSLTGDIVQKTYFEQFDPNLHLNPGSPTSNNPEANPVDPDACLFTIPLSTGRWSDGGNNDFDDTMFEYFNTRNQTLVQLQETNKITIQVHGRTDYGVGQLALVSIPRDYTHSSTDEDLDLMLSGLYMITKIKHSIALDKHVCTIELCKDSYIQMLYDQTKM